MFSKTLRLLVVFGVAVGLPYAWFNPQVSQRIRNKATSWVPSESPRGEGGFSSWLRRAPVLSATVPSTEPSAEAGSVDAPLDALPDLGTEGRKADPLATVLRMDLTHEWITSRWPRVSTVRAEQNLLGFRVPYVSGTRVDDFSGSLTYYFDDLKRLRRINLHGYTGDHRRIVAIVSDLFNLQQEPNLRAGLLVGRWNSKPTNILWVTHAPVVRQVEPHWRYEVKLEINRPDYEYRLSDEFAALMIHEHERRPKKNQFTF